MALSIKHPDADRLARELAATTGESLTDAILVALQERLERERARRRVDVVREEIQAIRRRCRALAVRDPRSAEEIVGYDDDGVPS